MAETDNTIFSGFVAQEVEQEANRAGYDFSGVNKPKNDNDMYGLRDAEFVGATCQSGPVATAK